MDTQDSSTNEEPRDKLLERNPFCLVNNFCRKGYHNNGLGLIVFGITKFHSQYQKQFFISLARFDLIMATRLFLQKQGYFKLELYQT